MKSSIKGLLVPAGIAALAMGAGAVLTNREASAQSSGAALATQVAAPAAGLNFFGGALVGTKCWVLDPVVGKNTFISLHFLPIAKGHSVLSGQAVLNDGTNPDRVLQMSGSASKDSYTATDSTTIERYLLDLNYSFSKTGRTPAKAFAETGAVLTGHYAVRLKTSDLNGFLEGNDLVIDWQKTSTPGFDLLTGPSNTYTSQHPATPYPGGLNNYLGGLQCDNTVPGFNNCGTVIPVNNAGTLTLVGEGPNVCEQADPRP